MGDSLSFVVAPCHAYGRRRVENMKNLGLAGTALALATACAFGTSGVASAATGVQHNDAVIAASFVDGSFAAGASSGSGRTTWSVGGTWAQPYPATLMITQVTADGEHPVNIWELSGGVNAAPASWTIHDGRLTLAVEIPAATLESKPMVELRVENPEPNAVYSAHLSTNIESQRLVLSPVGAGMVVERTLH